VKQERSLGKGLGEIATIKHTTMADAMYGERKEGWRRVSKGTKGFEGEKNLVIHVKKTKKGSK